MQHAYHLHTTILNWLWQPEIPISLQLYSTIQATKRREWDNVIRRRDNISALRQNIHIWRQNLNEITIHSRVSVTQWVSARNLAVQLNSSTDNRLLSSYHRQWLKTASLRHSCSGAETKKRNPPLTLCVPWRIFWTQPASAVHRLQCTSAHECIHAMQSHNGRLWKSLFTREW